MKIRFYPDSIKKCLSIIVLSICFFWGTIVLFNFRGMAATMHVKTQIPLFSV